MSGLQLLLQCCPPSNKVCVQKSQIILATLFKEVSIPWHRCWWRLWRRQKKMKHENHQDAECLHLAAQSQSKILQASDFPECGKCNFLLIDIIVFTRNFFYSHRQYLGKKVWDILGWDHKRARLKIKMTLIISGIYQTWTNMSAKIQTKHLKCFYKNTNHS